MYIEPNTVIKILKNCPLDNTYEHTLYFTGEGDTGRQNQADYFSSLAKYPPLTKQSYQRVGIGKMRVSIPADNLYDCNYLMFQNSGFGNKWFYAFIKSVEYVNNSASEIEFEIDVMQTWYFDYELCECFVEREHTATDVIGEHTVPEGLETGPYMTTATSDFTIDDLNIYVLSTENLGGGLVWNSPGMVGGFPVPCYWMSLGTMREFAVDLLQLILDVYASVGKADAIVAVFTAPSNMVSTESSYRVQTFEGANRILSKQPKNNKLYTYPYCCLTVSALGQGVELRYELFANDPTFMLRGGFGANMQVSCSPLAYAGRIENLEYCLSIKDFPICAWVTDYFQNWLAQNKSSIAVNTINNIASAAVHGMGSAMTGNVVGGAGAIVSGVSSVTSQLASIQHHSIIPDKMVGSANAADIMAVAGMSGFYTSCKSILPEYVDIIDNFFTMYGYKINTVKVPNRNVRKYWTFTKTQNCVAKGSVPCDDMKTIINIYNKGITFWNDGNNVGNYSLDNSVL